MSKYSNEEIKEIMRLFEQCNYDLHDIVRHDGYELYSYFQFTTDADDKHLKGRIIFSSYFYDDDEEKIGFEETYRFYLDFADDNFSLEYERYDDNENEGYYKHSGDSLADISDIFELNFNESCYYFNTCIIHKNSRDAYENLISYVRTLNRIK